MMSRWPWVMGSKADRRRRTIFYQYRADPARRTLRGIDEQVAKAEAAVAGKTPVKRNRFVTLTGGDKTVNRDLEAKARALAGIKGYTTNLPLAEIRGGKAWVATTFEGEPLAAEHGGPARLLVPHLYFWKSAKWVRSLRLMPGDEPGFWEVNGYHQYGDPWREQRYW